MISRTAGWLSVACGVAGLLIALTAIAGVWIVHAQVDAQVVALADDVNRRLDRAEASLAQVRARLDAIRGRARQFAERGDALVQSGAVGREAVEALVQAIDREFGDEYRQFREAWSELHARVETIMDSLERLQHAVPMVKRIALPRDELLAIDQRAGQIEDAVRSLRSRLPTVSESATSAVQGLVDGLRRVDDGVGTLAQAVEAFESRFQSTRGAVFTVRTTAQAWLMLGAILLTLVCLYGALTHAALIVYGRGHLQ